MKVIDLTKRLYDGMDVYPGDPNVSVNVVHTHEREGWELRALTLGSHTGTHVDAPRHMVPSGATLDDVPLDRFIGSAERVLPTDDAFPVGCGLLFHEPIDEQIAARLLDARPSFVGGPMNERLERILLSEGILTYTDLVSVDRLPLHTPFTFIGLPLRIAEGDGSPVRAVALLDE